MEQEVSSITIFQTWYSENGEKFNFFPTRAEGKVDDIIYTSAPKLIILVLNSEINRIQSLNSNAAYWFWVDIKSEVGYREELFTAFPFWRKLLFECGHSIIGLLSVPVGSIILSPCMHGIIRKIQHFYKCDSSEYTDSIKMTFWEKPAHVKYYASSGATGLPDSGTWERWIHQW